MAAKSVKVTFAHILAHIHLKDELLVAKPTLFRSRNPKRMLPIAKSYLLMVVIIKIKIAAYVN